MVKKVVKKRRQRSPLEDSPEPVDKDIYGLRETDVETFSSGCTLLDGVLGGGWPEGRVSNAVGDTSSGKTLLAIEASANFYLKYKGQCEIEYRESESAFDERYARTVGLPPDKVNFKPWPKLKKTKAKTKDRDEDGAAAPETVELGMLDTIEDLFEDVETILDARDKQKRRLPMLYIVDSLDSLSDRDEQERSMDEGTYGGGKSKKLSEFFRRVNKRMARSGITLFIISQLRDAIGVRFGEQQKPSGGRALEYYATTRVWLARTAQIKKTIGGVERVVGVDIRCRCKKNKNGPAFRDCDFPILFGYGIEDVYAGLDWLVKVKRTEAVGLKVTEAEKLRDRLHKLPDQEYLAHKAKVSKAVSEVWEEIEDRFRVKRRKYADAPAT